MSNHTKGCTTVYESEKTNIPLNLDTIAKTKEDVIHNLIALF